MKKITVIGHFAFGKHAFNGQTIKTFTLYNELVSRYGKENILTIDTHGGLINILKSPFQTFSALKNAKNVIILPCINGVRVYGVLVPLFRKMFFRDRKILYVVIGGFLSKFIENKPFLKKFLKKFDGIFIEAKSLKQDLVEKGFNNVYVVPNTKTIKSLSEDKLVYNTKEPLRLLTFSRILFEKGIEDAVSAVKEANKRIARDVYALDIYGPVEKDYEQRFEEIQKEFPDYISYKGIVETSNCIDVIKDYYALLFPTFCENEGFAGTLIDALFAGVPVISTFFRINPEIIEENVTGLFFPINDIDKFADKLVWAYENQTSFQAMKKNCIKEAQKYTPDKAFEILYKNIQ